MKLAKTRLCRAAVVWGLSCLLNAQQATPSLEAVPRLVNFSGRALDVQGRPVTGITGVTFAIYKDQYESAPLWIETQNIWADAKGNYTVQLGASKSEGLPLELFASGDARWLGLRVNGESEQPRVLLLSVPYALKAADAQTLGGLPPSAFMMAPRSPIAGTFSSSSSNSASSAAVTDPDLGGSGTKNYLPLWTDSSGTLGNSVFFQSGSGSTAKIGLNLTNPLATLDINGTTLIRGTLEPITKGIATASKGFNSNPLDLEASAFSSSTQKAVMQHFEWQAEPTGNNTSSPGATLNLLFGQDNNIPLETGLKLSRAGVFTFAPGQTFPGSGTVTSVGFAAPASDFTVTGSPITKNGTLDLNWNIAPTNGNSGNAIVKRDANGAFSAGEISASTAGSTSAALTGQSAGGMQGVLGIASGSAGQGVWGESFATDTVNGVGPDGVHGVNHSTQGAGVAGLSIVGNGQPDGVGVYGQGSTGVYGFGSGFTGTGVAGSSSLGSGVAGSSNLGPGVYGSSSGGTGVFGSSPSGFGFATDSNVQQARAMGGWVKAMVYILADSPPYHIARCFNSTLAGAAATTPPCGFNYTETAFGQHNVDFGFEVDDRFVMVAPGYQGGSLHSCDKFTCDRLLPQLCLSSDPDLDCVGFNLSANQALIVLLDQDGHYSSGTFYLTVY